MNTGYKMLEFFSETERWCFHW